MSSRDDIWGFLETNWTATPIYALDDIFTLDDLPATNETAVLLVDFPSALERLTTIAVHLTNGYREDGTVQLVMCHPIGGDANVTRALSEDLRNMLRARRIDKTVIQTVDSFTSVGNHDGKWQLFVSLASYYHDSCH